ncbi:MAG TPA: alpha/beta hydrolase, partial [Sphingopyxis sp.]|nr:alpha/beta hydrolase [Sphingopyxis sp.]
MVSTAALVRTLIVASLAAVLAFAPAQAQQVITVTTTTVSWTYADDDGGGAEDGAAADETTGLLDDAALAEGTDLGGARRYAPAAGLAARGHARARFGPFEVVDAATVRMAGDVDSATPREFAAMLAAYPGLRRLEMVDCPGSLDEAANLTLARA